MERLVNFLEDASRMTRAIPKKSVNGTPKCCAFWFLPLSSGARYVQRI